MANAQKIPLKTPERNELALKDTWDLSSLYPHDADWEKGLAEFQKGIPQIAQFKGKLAQSASTLAQALSYVVGHLELQGERLGYYVSLRQSENIGDTEVQGLYSRYMAVSTQFNAASSWMEPEIQAIDETTITRYLKDESLAEYRLFIKKNRRFKPHILSVKEELLLAKQGESIQTPQKAFAALTDVDLDFGSIETDQGTLPLTQSSFSALRLNKNRTIRKKAYKQFYQSYETHKNTIAELYIGSVLRDKYLAEVRGYSSARSMALFPDKVSQDVYDNLISSVRNNLPALHDYYALRAECLGITGDLRHWDIYVSPVDTPEVHHSWDEAVTLICESLAPLGSEYGNRLRKGLQGRWVDRYENKGKRSGAFSAGSYIGDPYILMNFNENLLRDVFVLAHEAGHSMHSWYSSRSNPFPHYQYSIFEAEVASTFNEKLLADKLIRESDNQSLKSALISQQIDDSIATIYRQTMFAEFEHRIHQIAEANEALSVDILRQTYRELLQDYFGPAITLDKESDLEGLRIPHFYNAFYVYKYATGLSAATALAERVLTGGKEERDAYLSFLKSGGSRYPLEALKLAGVDMAQPKPVDQALKRFQDLVEEFRKIHLKSSSSPR